MALDWIQDHLLSILSVGLTIILLYHYLIERDKGTKLSQRYRNSIFEAQSKIFLNATQYLISGHKDLAIKEFLNAVDINRETLETYFALGGLFRSNGEIDKSISIHRSLIARDNISESTRLRALKELAIDFDKGGFIDKAIETYKDVLKINRDQFEVIHSLCRIYEDIEDWDNAYNYRIMLSKSGHESQAETISHILVQKAKAHFEKGDLIHTEEFLDDAFRFAPSVSAKILSLKFNLAKGNMEQSKALFIEILREHPMFTSFIFLSLEEGPGPKVPKEENDIFKKRVESIKESFLEIDTPEVLKSPAVILAKVRLLKEKGGLNEAYHLIENSLKETKTQVSEVLTVEHIRLLIELNRRDEAMAASLNYFNGLQQSLTRHFCRECGYNSDNIFWRCPQCHAWETIQFRWKV